MQSKSIRVQWAGHEHKVRVIDAFDTYLSEFAEEVGGQLTDARCPFGGLLWPCARTLAQFLHDDTCYRRFQPLRIIELGCGVGFISCVLSSLYPHADVVAADYEGGLATFVKRNAEDWSVASRVQFVRVDWREPLPESWEASFDLVVGTDVFYDDSHLVHLPAFAAALLKPSGRLLLADPKRYRFGKALELINEHFVLTRHIKIDCAMNQDGIEDFMINRGLEKQEISILDLEKR